MKVDSNPVNSHLNVNSTKNQKVDGGKNNPGEDGKVGATDLASSAKVDFSDQAQTFSKAKELATPDMDTIREDKVAHFQKLIDSGNYHVDAAAVADRLVDEHLMS